ncbi:DUF4214 domain-containing protein [Nitrosomonas sp. Nm166]|uniref:DUF4214 domain-containing protein n=1 Tax=Nitrosomonas sp. Nm166 TaxID=1881054 RepID=UPI0008F1A9D6|nr:DUF4214 domain-containing protein [Nitrosomonas sp. Nm166]SFD94603.1 protein of unknown function [Nitrosomonas sp. Nm166]
MTITNFDSGSLVDNQNVTSATYSGWTFGASSSIDIVNASNSEFSLLLNQSGGRSILLNYGGLSVTDFFFKSSDGSDFQLNSFNIDNGPNGNSTSLAISGYRDGVLVVASESVDLTTSDAAGNISYTQQGNVAPSISGSLIFNSAFNNIDEIRFAFDSDVELTIDDIDTSAAAVPTITSATYDASTNSLVVTGTNMTATSGAFNDIDVSKLTLTGQGGATYTLTSSNVEITSATSFTVALNATDQLNVEGLLNKNGTSSVDATTFNIAAAADWNPAQSGNADTTGNAITVSNVQTPTITSATYDASTGSLVVTGANFVKASGATNDITANKFTFTGEGGATHTLTDTANVEITSGTAFIITLSATDKAAVNQIVNKNGGSSTDISTYILSAADDWNTVIGNTNIADTFNNITASNVAVPAITSAAYDASTGALVVTGTGFLSRSGATNDIVANKFTFTGEGGATYTLTDSANVEITSGTAFTITLSSTDKAAINQIVNKNGTSSTGGTTYNLAAAEDWAAGADAAVNVADTTGNGITVSNVAAPAITSATYDASTGALVVAGSDFLTASGAANDIDASKFTFTGEGGATYSLTDTTDVEITSGTALTITLSATDKAAINQIVNKNGTSSTGGTTYNLAAAEDWAAGADAAVSVADTTGNGITVSNVATPTITSATYDASTGALVVTGSGFLIASGAANDIDASKFTFTGEGGATYTLTDTASVEITSGAAFTITLSTTDKVAINQIVNKNGTSSTGGTTYNLAAAEDWAAGADAAVSVADTTGNGITVSNVATPTITSATYDASTGALVVTGSGFLIASGTANDIDASKFTFTGEGGATYMLTDSANVEITSGTSFTLTLSSTDKAAINQIVNKNGTSSTGGTTYNLAAAEDWAAGTDAVVSVADLTGNGITASNVAVPAITSATYDASTGALVVTGTDFLSLSGANDIDASKFTFTGEGGAAYTLTDSADVEITSGTSFTLTLSSNDKTAVNQIVNKNGTSSTGGTTYNLAAAEDWAAGTDAVVSVADLTGNGITASNVAVPAITSATYDASTGALVVTGTDFLSLSGANDIDASKFTFTGEGGAAYTLTDSADVEITSGTSFTLTLSSNDKTAVNQIVNKNGTSSTGGTTYSLAAAEDWAAGADAAANVADTTGNGITVSNVAAPAITSATYDASTGALVVTGTGFMSLSGATNDIVANKFTFTGEGGTTYTLTDSANVEITSGTAFTITLSSTDKAAVNQIINKNGTSSTDGITYNLAAAEDWAAGADAAANVADTTGNGITVSNVAAPAITSATYDASTGALVVTGTGFMSLSGATNDIVANKFTFTGEGGTTYTLTDSANVEITSGTAFTITLSSTDKAAVNQIVNKNGTSSTGGTTYNLAAAEDWAAGADAAVNVADTTGNGITVSNVAAPVITSATYDASTGALVVTGSGFLKNDGAANDIDASKFTFTGEGGATYSLTDTADVEITSGTSFTLTLSSTDKAAVNQIVNKNGTSSTGGTTYNLTAAEDWAAGADAAVDVADTTGNGITVSNVAAPAITSATYDASTGALVVTDSGFLSLSGAANDIDVSKFTFTGEGGATYTLTDTADVEITSGTSFTITLSSTDKAAINQIINKNGTSSTVGTTYNLAAAEDWAAGADAAVTVADTTGNGITISNVAVPTITSAAYDYNSNVLTVTGTGFLQNSGTGNDIDVSKLIFTGEGGATYTLTSTTDVEITSGTSFSVTLTGDDLINVEALLNQDGTTAVGGTTYNLAAAEDWAVGADAAVAVIDLTGNAITVSNYAAPEITSATFDASTNILTVTGTNLVSSSGATNDVAVSLLTLTGEGGSYTLTSANAEITSATSFSVTLNAADQLVVHGLLNKNGTASSGATTYNIAAAEDWMTGTASSTTVADLTGNGITVSNVQTPTITSATYDAETGLLVVTGTNLFNKAGADNDIDISTLTLTGGTANATYMITSASDVEITSATSFSVTLSGIDKTNVDALLDQTGTTSSDSSTYNLAAADNWLAGADIDSDISDATNAMTVSVNPRITSATYDASTGSLTVTATNLQANGGGADIDISRFTFTGESGTTYTLTDTADVEITSSTAFTITLSSTDKAAVNQIINKDGTSSTGDTAYDLAAADGWNTNVTTGDTTDASGNGITVSNVALPAITSATYDASTGTLVISGTSFLKSDGAANDIDASKFTFTGEGGATYTLTDTASVEITSGTAFTITLGNTDTAAVNQIVNKDGTTSTDATTYNLAAAEDWATGADAAVNVIDAIGNGITVSNVAAPAITSATYDASTGVLVVTGTDFLKSAANDIDASKFTFTGEGGATYTLTDSADVEITSGTAFTITLSATDKTAINQIINKSGTASSDATTYNLAAAEDWAAGADATVTGADLVDNGITATVPSTSSSGSGGGGNTSPITTTVDGVTISATTQSNGTVVTTVPPVGINRQDDSNSLFRAYADIPVITHSNGDVTLTVSLPAGVGLNVAGKPQSLNLQDATEDLIRQIEQKTHSDSHLNQEMISQTRGFLSTLGSDERITVQAITPSVNNSQVPNIPIIISGSNSDNNGKQVLIVDVRNLPSGTIIQLDDVAFASIIGATRVVGGNGENFVVGDDQNQFIVLGADDDILLGGGGKDTVGSLSGNDQTSGDAGDDIVFGGTGNDRLSGGTDNDQLNGGLGFDSASQDGQLSDYQITVHGDVITLTHTNGDMDTFTDVELIRFTAGPSLAIAHSATEAVAHHLVKTWLGRDLTGTEGDAVQNWISATTDDILTAFYNLPEAVNLQDVSQDELLAGLETNPAIIQLDATRTVNTDDGDDQGYLPLGLALNADGGAGHDVLYMAGRRDDVHLEFVNDHLELTRFNDGAMLSLKNAEMIAFDRSETVAIAHDQIEAILARLVHSFFNRDATVEEWQSGREALSAQVSHDAILDWFQQRAGLNALSNTDYVQTMYTRTLGRSATGEELSQQLSRLDSHQIDREWLAVEIAQSAEATAYLVGNVMLQEGWI